MRKCTERKVLEILNSGKVNYWTGSVGMAFERAFATWVGVRNAVSVMSGEAARRVAYLALDRDPPVRRAPTTLFPAVHKVGKKITYFAFGEGSPITCGGQGGMVCTDDDELAWEIRSIRDHGYDARAKFDLLKKEGRSCYIHRRLGYNFRLTEIQSVLANDELQQYVDNSVDNCL